MKAQDFAAILTLCLSLGAATAAVAQGGNEQVRQASGRPPARSPRPGVENSLGQSSASSVSPAASDYRAVLDRYCVTCHSERLRTGNLVLAAKAIDLEHLSTGAATWEKVVAKLRAGAMPPPGRPRPDEATYQAFASWLEGELDRAAEADPEPGRPPIHRLNRTEYTNVIRDLLALEIDGRSLLPADDMAYGFDNNANTLKMSPALLERYVSAATRISSLAVGDPTIRPAVERHAVSPLRRQDDRLGEDLPFGTRGGIALRHYFPLDADYRLSIHLQRGPGGNIRGLAAGEQIDVRLDGTRIKLFTLGGEPGDAPSKPTADAALEVRFPAKAGQRVVVVTFLKHTLAADGIGPARLPAAYGTFDTNDGRQMTLDSVEISGPFQVSGSGDTPSRRRIFVCRPDDARDEEACARQILATLARRAYRRPITESDVEALVGFYKAGRRPGEFESAIQRALERILADPEFLFRIERDPANVVPGEPYRISDLELASRLSFFLWSSMPDDELLDLAAGGELADPVVLERQVRRMLDDRRAHALVSNFASQWLHLRNMAAVAPDVKEFPEFDEDLREAFQRETELFLESQLNEDRGVGELLTADYTYVNERLARHYGIPKVYGSHFRRVTVTDEARRGLLGHGSVLAVTSFATRTSPVVRGKWLLDNILGAPPPAPPPNVPDLAENTAGDQPRSVRERMEQHRRNPTCASCHARMDPLGFALENFDAIGEWRSTTEAGTPIDASGTLPDGTALDGPVGLRRLLHSRRDVFATTVTTKLLIYALGRRVEYYDMPAIRKIVREAAPRDHRWSSIILGIVKSTPFQMKVR